MCEDAEAGEGGGEPAFLSSGARPLWGRRAASPLRPASPRGMDGGAAAEAAAEAPAGAVSADGSRMASATGPCLAERD